MFITGNVLSLFDTINEYWSPKVIAEVDDQYIKLAKLKGELVWHDHENQDEMFYIIKGSLDIQLENESVTLNQGDFYVIKKGTKHNPKAENECWVMLIEKKDTEHTGKVVTGITKSIEDQLK